MSGKKDEWTYRIVRDSMGSFLDPPGSPQHTFSVRGWYGVFATRDADFHGSLWSALDDEYCPESVKERIRDLFKSAELRASDAWLDQVYGYFKNCYAPEDGDRDVQRAIILKPDDEPLPPERHLAYLHVKQWFPDTEPDLARIESKGNYGTAPCSKCGQTVQYEAKFDAWAKFGESPDCPKGGLHTPSEER